ncbi:CotH kinase family protein [Bacillus sp. CGMCC 1.16607]|uniref:CotH kinase family protein n=1 Tax=Bacillus sp. CGMCC 1.16607 TaxID=3351842 RepID=UPI00363D9BEF
MSEQSQLPTYQVFIHPNDYKELRSDIWCEDPVAGYLKMNKKKWDIDIVYRGSHTRKFKKKSFHIAFFQPKLFLGAKEIHLNAEYKDPSLMRNKLSFDFFRSIGVLAPESRHVILNINGKTEGVYLQIESVDENFFQKRNYPLGAIFYAVDGDANFSLLSDLDNDVKESLDLGYEMKVGNQEDLGHLQELIYKINTLSRVEFEENIHKYVNVNQYLRWLAGVIFTQNYDGFVHNYSLIRNASTGQFEVSPWDYDGTWGRDVNGKVMEYDYVRIEGFNTLTARILDIPSFRMEYRSLLESILESEYTVERLQPQIMNLYHSLRPYILKDPYKQQQLSQFDQEPEFILDFIKERSKYIYEKLRDL